MKQILFSLTLLCSMLLLQIPTFANDKVDANATRKTILLQGAKKHIAQRTPFPAQAFLTERLLTIESLYLNSDFTVTITDLSTGEVTYKQIHKANTEYITIDLSAEKTGEYKIELSSANWLLYGDFSL